MKRTMFILAILATATILFAQQKYRREHMICPIDGQRMERTGNQEGVLDNTACEFSHTAFVDMKQVEHKAWASCTETR